MLDHRSIARIQDKVASGEALDRAEFSTLEQAASSSDGPSLRTALGQALINAGETESATELLEGLCRQYPTHVEAHLALGRALVCREKWGDAERVLERAHRMNRMDPEPLKALAVADMRRGELRRARARVDDALELDPFDVEALQLLGELEAQLPGGFDVRDSLDEFARALTTQLRRQSTPHRLQRDVLLVRVGDRVARLSIEALHDDYRASGRPLAEAVELIGAELAERSLGLPPERGELLARVFPVLRGGGFLDRGVGSVRREAPGGLWHFYVIDDPHLVRYVPEGILESHGVTLDELDEAAWKNLHLRPAEIRALEVAQGTFRVADEPTGLWALAEGDGYDCARLLTSHHQAALEQLSGSRRWRVYLGLRELALVCREDDAVALGRLESLDAARDGIAGAWSLADGRLAPLRR